MRKTRINLRLIREILDVLKVALQIIRELSGN